MPRVLIIEDDTDINNSTAEYLRRQGCECVQAYSGTEGRRLWQEGGFDLLLVDLMLPGLSGGELIAEIRRSAQTPVIVLSARAELSDKVELLSLGADDYLTKPYQLEELWARIQVQLRAGQPKRVFTKQQIYEAVWGDAYAVEDKTITVHVSNIRAKLRPSGTDSYIQTVWGIGFKLSER